MNENQDENKGAQQLPLVVKILAFIMEHERKSGNPVSTDHVLGQFGGSRNRASALLRSYARKQHYLTSIGEDGYKITPKGLQHLQDYGYDVSDFMIDSTPPPKDERTPLTTEADRFRDLGVSALNVAEGIANTVTDLVFRGDWKDPDVVWKVLKSTNLRGDLITSWFDMWMLEQKIPIPEHIRAEMPGVNKELREREKEKEKQEDTGPKRYNVYGTQIVRDPHGDFTYHEALGVREQNVMLARSDKDPPAQPPQDKPSEMITALSNALATSRDTLPKDPGNEALLLSILKTMVENPKDGASQEATRQIEKLREEIDRLKDPGDPFAAVSGQMDMMARMMGFPDAAAMSASLHKPPSGPTYEPKDFRELLHLQDRYRGWDREDASDKSKRDNTAAIRQTAANLATAIPSALRKMDQMIKEGRVPFTEPPPPPAAPPQVRDAKRQPLAPPDSTAIPLPGHQGVLPPQVETVECPGCNKPFTMAVGATEAICPHCGMHLVVPEEETPEAPEAEAPEVPPTAPESSEERPMKEVLPDRSEVLGRLEGDPGEMPEEEPPQGHNYGIEIGAANDPASVIAENFVETPENDEEPKKHKPKRKPKGGSDATV